MAWTLTIFGMLLKYALQVTGLGVRIGGGMHFRLLAVEPPTGWFGHPDGDLSRLRRP